MKILLVDDSRTMRNIWKKVVSSTEGTETAEAGDGVEALQVIEQSGPFDLMLLDLNQL